MRKPFLVAVLSALMAVSCATLPTPSLTRYALPTQGVYLNDADRPYQALGLVRTKVNFSSLDPAHEESELCRNFFNKAIADLLVRARKVGGDAIVDVKSVVFLQDGRQEFHKGAECADDGQEGQILAQAIAVKWTQQGDKPVPHPVPTPEMPFIEDTEQSPSTGSPFESPLHSGSKSSK